MIQIIIANYSKPQNMMQTNKFQMYKSPIELWRRQIHPQNQLKTTKKMWGLEKKKKKGIFPRMQKGIHEIQNTYVVSPKSKETKCLGKGKRVWKQEKVQRSEKRWFLSATSDSFCGVLLREYKIQSMATQGHSWNPGAFSS